MPCTTAWLIKEPVITERNEEYKSSWNPKTRSYVHWTQPLLLTEYLVDTTYDYGFCCGVDGTTFTFATREAAQELIDQIHNNEHKWIKYDPDFIEDDDENV